MDDILIYNGSLRELVDYIRQVLIVLILHKFYLK
jgi:hypothetical protein